VRGPKHVIKHGKTPVLTTDQARVLIESLDTSTIVGLRDRALIGVMTYAFARIGAVVAMRGVLWSSQALLARRADSSISFLHISETDCMAEVIGLELRYAERIFISLRCRQSSELLDPVETVAAS
jgi:hypothetical protein